MTIGQSAPGAWVAVAPLAALDAIRPRAYAALSPAERRRVATLSDRAADEVILGRWLLRTLAVEALANPALAPADVAVAARCPECGREHGQPTFPGHALLGSVTHSGDLAAAAVARVETWSALGIDTEPLGAQGLSEHQLRHWTEHEARAKARGTGIVHPDETDGPWHFVRLDTPGYVTTLALRC